MIGFYLRRLARLLTEHIDGLLLAAVLSLMAWNGTSRYTQGNGRSASQTAVASTGLSSWNAAPPKRWGTTATTCRAPQRVVYSGTLLMSS